MRLRSVLLASAGALSGAGLVAAVILGLSALGRDGATGTLDPHAAAVGAYAGEEGRPAEPVTSAARPGSGGAAWARGLPRRSLAANGPGTMGGTAVAAPAGGGRAGAPEAGTGAESAAATAPKAAKAANPQLSQRLTALLADPRLDGAATALHVTDEAGHEVFDHAGDEPLLPASTTKLVTAAAALAQLGPEFRFTTSVSATVPPDAGGVVHGDLVLVGGGDPALGSPAFATHVMTERPRTPIEALADQISAAGVRRVTGRVLGDPTALPDQPVAQGWLDRYLSRGDATRSSGLTVDAGRRLFQVNGELHSAPAEDPAAVAAATLTELLVERGVAVDGEPTATLSRPEAPHALAAVESPPLVDLLTYMVQRSDNHLADTIFRAVGGATGDGSWAGSAQATIAALAPLELDWHGAHLADGSGLSRDDRLSARQLATLDARMQASNRGEDWRQLMAVSGRSGTLRRRLVGTVAEGRLAGKTGTLRDTRTLSGTVIGPDGARYHFALLSTALAGDAPAAARELQDLVVLALAEDLYGCVHVVVGQAAVDGDPAATPEAADGDQGADQATDRDQAADQSEGVDRGEGEGEAPVTELRCAA